MSTIKTLVFLDTETTSLRPDRRVWEVGTVIRRYVQLEDGGITRVQP